MAETEQTPLVRNQHGAILGIDYRRTDLAPVGVRVPGRIPARAVMPGDTVDEGGIRYVVHEQQNNGRVRHISTVSEDGAPTVFERRGEEVMHVVAVGAFDR